MSLLFSISQSLFAHSRWSLTGLVKPRTNATGLKEPAPCGGVARTNTPVVLKSGSTVEIQFEETINHPGHFRIAFSPTADAGFDENILQDNIPEVSATRFYTQTVTLPNIECDDCTLQLIQVMTDRSPPSNYYSCADIQLTTTTGTPPAPQDDTTPPQNVSEASIIAGDTQVTLAWKNPGTDFSKVLILQDDNSITDSPASSPVATTNYNLNDTIGSARVIYSGNSTSIIVDNLINGNQYNFKIFSFDASLNYATGVQVNTTLPANPDNIQPVVSLTAEQAQTETTRIVKTSGNVIIQASVSDVNPSDSHQLDWTMTDNRLIDIDNVASNFTFNPANLEPGIYNIQVDAIDSGVPAKTGGATMSIEVLEAANNSANTASSGGGLNIVILFLFFIIVAFREKQYKLTN